MSAHHPRFDDDLAQEMMRALSDCESVVTDPALLERLQATLQKAEKIVKDSQCRWCRRDVDDCHEEPCEDAYEARQLADGDERYDKAVIVEYTEVPF